MGDLIDTVFIRRNDAINEGDPLLDTGLRIRLEGLACRSNSFIDIVGAAASGDGRERGLR